MSKVIRLTESKLHRLINESVRRILREQDEDEYDWDNLDQDRKDFENHLSWRNKEEVDANDRAISKGFSPKSIEMSDDDFKRCADCFKREKDTRPDAKMHWDWGYKSGIEDPFSYGKHGKLVDLGDELDAHTDLVNGEDGMSALKYPDFHRAMYGGEELNESYINRIVKKTISRVLNEMDEGKYVNHKPYFVGLDGTGVKPGGYAPRTCNKFDPEGWEKHKERRANYVETDKLKRSPQERLALKNASKNDED